MGGGWRKPVENQGEGEEGGEWGGGVEGQAKELARKCASFVETTLWRSTHPLVSPLLFRDYQGGPGSVWFGCGLGMERFERFRFSVPAVPL